MQSEQSEAISRRNIYQIIAERLLTEIVENRLPPGALVPTERELAERYGVGRSSVREGLRMLESHQIIRPSTRGNYTVGEKNVAMVAAMEMLLSLGEASLDDIHQLRTLLEVEAAGLAALHHTEEDMAVIRQSLRDMINARNDRSKALEADLNFHVALSRASRNGALVASVMGVRTVWRQRLANRGFDINEAIAQHQLIIEAVLARDVEGARKQVADHMKWIAKIGHD